MKKIVFVITVLCLMMCVIACQKACEHSYEPNVLVEASCDEKGLIAYNCTLCGYCRLEEKPMIAHSFGEPKLGKESTCAEEGEMHITCTVCGTYEVVEKIPVIEHKYLPRITTAPTCAEEGVRTYSCSGCGDEYTEPINKTSHKYTSKITTAATCTKEGVKTLTCSYCRDQYTERIPAGNHSWTSANCTSAKKCSECGETSGSALGHSWKNATCTEAKKCTRCGEKTGSALGHSWKDATCTEAKNCTRCGETTGSAKGHTVVVDEAIAPTCTETGLTEGKHCSVCNVIIVAQKEIAEKHNDPYGICLECNEVTDEKTAVNHYVSVDTSIALGKICTTYYKDSLYVQYYISYIDYDVSIFKCADGYLAISVDFDIEASIIQTGPYYSGVGFLNYVISLNKNTIEDGYQTVSYGSMKVGATFYIECIDALTFWADSDYPCFFINIGNYYM